MKQHKKNGGINPKYLFLALLAVCCVLIAVSFTWGTANNIVQRTLGTVIVPMQSGLNSIGSWISSRVEDSKTISELRDENEQLQLQVDTLKSQISSMENNLNELDELRQLLELKESYPNYSMVGARIISSDASNWYDTFMINKGSNDGIRIDNNVIAGKGLVGIVTEVGPTWATVRSIIDDSSSVSAMTVSTSDNCIVTGDLELIDEGKLRFEQLYDQEGKVTVGERIVTSNISEKFVEGLFIGYVSDVQQDSNNLTKNGTIVTPVDFLHLKDVFVITVNKQDTTEETDLQAAQEDSNEE